MIEIRGLSHVYGRTGRNAEPLVVLDDINLTIGDNKFVSFLGPSGCGKTTLLRMLDGLLRPSHGEIAIDGELVTEPSVERTMVFQEFNLLPWRNARTNVEFPAELQRRPRAARARKALDALRLVSLEAFGNFMPHHLSGGMKQRVGIARALSVEPKYLFMDEPFGALDPMIREVMQIELLRILERERKTMVFVTHSVEESIFLSDQIVIFSARPGRVLKVIDVDFPSPRSQNDETIKASKQFAQYRAEIWSILKQEVQIAIANEGKARQSA